MAYASRIATPTFAIATALLPLQGLQAEIKPENWHHKVEIPRPPRAMTAP